MIYKINRIMNISGHINDKIFDYLDKQSYNIFELME